MITEGGELAFVSRMLEESKTALNIRCGPTFVLTCANGRQMVHEPTRKV
jgi:hypothetical protein